MSFLSRSLPQGAAHAFRSSKSNLLPVLGAFTVRGGSSLSSRQLLATTERNFTSALLRCGTSPSSLAPAAATVFPSLSSSLQQGPQHVPKRFLNLHEYQSKDLMAKYGIRVQKGQTASTPEEALAVAKQLLAEGAKELVIKAQIHAGGRGKGHFNTGFKGGVHVSTDPQVIANAAKGMLGNSLITKQTGPEGQVCKQVLIHEGIFFDDEYYFAILMDRAFDGPVIVASKEGGMDIEEVAEKNPDAIITVPVPIGGGITAEHTAKVGAALGLSGKVLQDAQQQMANLYKLFIETDCTQIEINPLVVTRDGLVYCVDAKLNFDENASFRHKDLFNLRDTSMEDPREVAASKAGLNYIGLDGNIGCMVNGAGLAMATMDIIQMYGASPANFLDVGGGANEKQVEQALTILTKDPKVEGILINIFGGIMKCDTIAAGVVAGAAKVDLTVPLVVRLEGTNVEAGIKILKDSGLPIITATNLDDAAQKAVAAIKS